MRFWVFLGQSIPKGLHVRINLQTGMTEAKLLDEDLREDAKKNALLALSEVEEKDNFEIEKIKVLEESKERFVVEVYRYRKTLLLLQFYFFIFLLFPSKEFYDLNCN